MNLSKTLPKFLFLFYAFVFHCGKRINMGGHCCWRLRWCENKNTAFQNWEHVYVLPLYLEGLFLLECHLENFVFFHFARSVLPSHDGLLAIH